MVMLFLLLAARDNAGISEARKSDFRRQARVGPRRLCRHKPIQPPDQSGASMM
jgi:hypothetical protein